MRSNYLPALFVLLAAACSDGASTDAGRDASLADGATGDAVSDPDARADAEPSTDARSPDSAVGFDGNELRDAAVDDAGFLTGTPLEGVPIQWTAPVELCSAWREGAPVTDEVSAKALVTIWPVPRPSLSHADLSVASLDQVIVRRGPFAAEQWTQTGASSALVDYRFYPQGGGAASLGAEIEHDLGPAGVLVEAFSVYREPGNTRPVDLTLGNLEHTFSLRRAGLDDVPALLERCDGRPELDDAVHVLTATRDGQAISIVRFARTTDAVAGSAPVRLRGLELRFSDPSLAPVTTYDFWAMTYAAQHHNWEDASHFDFSRDLAIWNLVYAPWQRTGQAPVPETLEALDLRGINGFSAQPEVDLVWRDFTTGAARTDTWSSAASWTRVDSIALGRTLSCTGGQVLTLLDYGQRAFQILTCPRGPAPGFTVESVVPVYFGEEVGAVGQSFGGALEVTVSGRAGYRVAVGGHRLVLTKNEAEPYYFLTIEDAAGNSVSESLVEPQRLWPASWGDELRYQNTTGDVSLTIVRRWIAQGVGESSIYAPVLVEASALGRSWRVEAWDRLDYQNTHHNWNDSMTVHAEDATLEWHHVFLEQRNTLQITAADGTVLLPETLLEME